MISKIGITERGDAAFNTKWLKWVKIEKKPAILISKQPELLINILINNDLLNAKNILFHINITGNGGTEMEPCVPNYKKSLESFYYLVEKYGKNRVVLRIDPIIPIEPYLKNSYAVLSDVKEKLGKDMTRVRISFLDNYNHVKSRMKEKGLTPFDYSFHAPLNDRKKIWLKMGQPEICGEPNMTSTSCVSEIDCEILGVEPMESISTQRKECHCLANKKELLNEKKPCNSKCIYCYWQND